MPPVMSVAKENMILTLSLSLSLPLSLYLSPSLSHRYQSIITLHYVYVSQL